MTSLAVLIVAIVVGSVISQLLKPKLRRDAAFTTLTNAARNWERHGWVPLSFEQRDTVYVVTFRQRDSDRIEELVVDA